MVIYITFPKIYTQIFSDLLDIFCFFLLQVTFQLLLVIILQLKKSYPITIFSPMSQLVFCALKCVKIKNTKTHLKFESGRSIEEALTPNHFGHLQTLSGGDCLVLLSRKCYCFASQWGEGRISSRPATSPANGSATVQPTRNYYHLSSYFLSMKFHFSLALITSLSHFL